MPKILVVDDEEKMCHLLKGSLEEDGYAVTAATNGQAALELLREESFDLVITDLRMSPVDGLQVLEEAKANPITQVVMMTAYASAETAVEAMKKGAYDYIIKPFDLEEMKLLVSRVLEKQRLEMERDELLRPPPEGELFPEIIGQSAAMVQTLELVGKVAPRKATVLITGESGTGKELIARAIHRLSPRRDKPFVVVNCAALPETLLESELFGHEKGAFTGADRKRLGRFALAHGGTLFLDEIGDISPGVQAKLLRVIQHREFVPLGSHQMEQADVRLVAATNRDLEQAMEEGRFREDLYYRLSVFPISLPPLRERTEDIPLLVTHLLSRLKYTGPGVTAQAMEVLTSYSWPGNVRELENILERAVILSGDGEIGTGHLPVKSMGSAEPGLTWRLPPDGVILADVERDLIRQALKMAEGNKSKAAQLLGITRRALYSRMEQHGLTDME
jgi:DNA-binding NtrC family response regulator